MEKEKNKIKKLTDDEYEKYCKISEVILTIIPDIIVIIENILGLEKVSR